MKRSKRLEKSEQKPKNNGSPKRNLTVSKPSQKDKTLIRSPSSRTGLRSSLSSRKITEFFSPSGRYSTDGKIVQCEGAVTRSQIRQKQSPTKLNKTVSCKKKHPTRGISPKIRLNIQDFKIEIQGSQKKDMDKCPKSNGKPKSNSRTINGKKSHDSGTNGKDFSSEGSVKIPSYQQILKVKEDCLKYLNTIQHLTDMIAPLLASDTKNSGTESNESSMKPFRLTRSSTRLGITPKSQAQLLSPKPNNSKISISPNHQRQTRNKSKSPKSRKLMSGTRLPPKNKENTSRVHENVENEIELSTEKMKCKLNFGNKQKGNNKTHTKGKNDSISKKIKKSNNGSYDKYGIYMPSHQDMLNQKESCDNYNDVVQSLMRLVVPLPEVQINPLNNQVCAVKALNCKSMTIEKLIAAYRNNKQYLEGIIDGTIPSERHEKFKSVVSREELTFNTSMIVFSNEQKQILASKLCERFGVGSSCSNYYFKVLLPELCLKIFMDEHSMSREQAIEYLDCYPVDM